MMKNIKTIITKYPSSFWALVFGTFIDRLGGFILAPFFALYMATKFEISMTAVGLFFTCTALGRMIGGFIAGALTDKIGRKFMMLFGLIVSGLSNLLVILINDLLVFYLVFILIGIFASAGGPAQSALVADILSEDQRSDGYGILRISFNIGATLGPIIGGLVMVSNNFNLLFILDAIMSCLTAIVVLVKIPETNPNQVRNELKIQSSTLKSNQPKKSESFIDILKGYRNVFSDGHFIGFVTLMIVMQLVYMQMYSTLAVYLLSFKGITSSQLGWILCVNALLVILFQFPLTQKTSKKKPMWIMAIGMCFYGMGFPIYGITSSYWLYMIAIILITIGEMIIFPTANTIVAGLAPSDKRGRYMAIYALGFTIPSLFGNVAAGAIYDNLGPKYVWFIAGILSIFGIIGFLLANKTSHERLTSHPKDESKSSLSTSALSEEEIEEVMVE